MAKIGIKAGNVHVYWPPQKISWKAHKQNNKYDVDEDSWKIYSCKILERKLYEEQQIKVALDRRSRVLKNYDRKSQSQKTPVLMDTEFIDPMTANNALGSDSQYSSEKLMRENQPGHSQNNQDFTNLSTRKLNFLMRFSRPKLLFRVNKKTL
ncbi:hypothetical protein ACFFRR_005645 [Megaselia abdita]